MLFWGVPDTTTHFHRAERGGRVGDDKELNKQQGYV